MNNDTDQTEAAEQYAVAHAAHYVAKDLPKALELYTEITSTHPDAPEAGYSRSQLQSIVKSVVPKPELLSAQVELALTYLQRAEPRKEPPLRSGAQQESSDEALDHA